MDSNETIEQQIAAAKAYAKLGYRPLPLLPRSKQPAVAWKWLQTEHPSEAWIEEVFARGERGIALATGLGVVVVDVDDPAETEAVIEHCGYSPMRCRTPSGGWHLYYGMRNGVTYGGAVRIKRKRLDLRCETHYVVVPWSRSAKGLPYEWAGPVLPVSELPLLNVSWLRERKTAARVVAAIETDIDTQRTIRRATAYLGVVEGAISGQGGHNVAFRAACVLTQKFGLAPEIAFPLFWDWNIKTCEPPFSERECWHKLNDAWKKKPK